MLNGKTRQVELTKPNILMIFQIGKVNYKIICGHKEGIRLLGWTKLINTAVLIMINTLLLGILPMAWYRKWERAQSLTDGILG